MLFELRQWWEYLTDGKRKNRHPSLTCRDQLGFESQE